MEACHTNPVLICFCSILYYRDLSEHLRRYRNEKRRILETEEIDYRMIFKLKKFNGYLPPDTNRKQIYSKKNLNKWHLLLRLSLNKELIDYRGTQIALKKALHQWKRVATITDEKLKITSL